LFRSIPQMGDVTFNSTYLAGSSNSARGDVGSVNLRNLGIGNTLVLLNGRRVVQHPTSQANENLVPVLTYNTNAIPVSGLRRLEVLRDGAAAIYGTDAVAGVINTVLKDDYDGVDVSVQYGGAEGTDFREFKLSGVAGQNFAGGRGNVSLFFNYDNGSGLGSSEQSFTASSDKRPLFAGTRFDGATSLDGRESTTAWASLATPASFGTVRQGTRALTTSAGAFHIQPSTNAGCQLDIGNGLCIDDNTLSVTGADRNLRRDTAAQNTSVIPSLDRVNLFLTGKYELSDSLTVFGEAGYYHARTEAVQGAAATLSSIPMTIAASNYWNPFGPVRFADGTLNPNRIAGTNVPAAGLPVAIRSYAFEDAGLMNVEVTNRQGRFLAGLRGGFGEFDWEGALLYSEARAKDVSDNISVTALARQLALSTPDAYNPFNGGNLASPTFGDATPSSAAAIDAIKVEAVRRTKATLALADLRLSNPRILSLPGGEIGMAAGAELRRETQLDDRDPRVDGTITFTDPLTGTVTGDLVNSSLSPDTRGNREVGAAYVEFAVPVVSPEMGIPLIRRLELQLAGRYEHYSDFGGVAKPKVAGAWDLVDGLRLRGSWAQGFRAPNLEQVNATVVTRSNSRTDYTLCEADLRAGRIASFANCSRSQSTSARRSGNPSLNPEESDTLSLGVVLEPPLPDGFGALTLTGDWWRVKQTGLVGIFGEGNALILDYLERQNGGSNPNVIRAAPTADDVALFAGTGLAPAGQVLYVLDQYQNLQPQRAEGVDLGLMWRLRDTGVGDFTVNLNAAHLLEFYQDPSPGIAALLAAREAGEINAATPISGGGDLIRDRGRPEWKWSAALTWNYGPVTVGAFTQYIGSVDDTSLRDAAGSPWVVESQITANLYGEYAVGGGALDGTRFRLGVRNLTDEKPPLSSDGYIGRLHSPVTRYWYLNIARSF
jgi:outer membrane receptor protein involved in Fe transport